MPLYEFECSYCGQRLELHRRLASRDDPLTHRHEETGRVINAPMRRVFAVPTVHFKGPGVTRGSEAKPTPPEHGDESPA